MYGSPIPASVDHCQLYFLIEPSTSRSRRSSFYSNLLLATCCLGTWCASHGYHTRTECWRYPKASDYQKRSLDILRIARTLIILAGEKQLGSKNVHRSSTCSPFVYSTTLFARRQSRCISSHENSRTQRLEARIQQQAEIGAY